MCSKSALTESLEIDEYMWAILENSKGFDEVTIDAQGNWKAVKPIKVKLITFINFLLQIT